MVLSLLISLAAAAAQPAPAPTPASVTPQARMIFEKHWELMNWALKFYDRDRDILLEPDEAQSAAAAFRDMADVNHDGRVTTDEYSAARAFILARY